MSNVSINKGYHTISEHIFVDRVKKMGLYSQRTWHVQMSVGTYRFPVLFKMQGTEEWTRHDSCMRDHHQRNDRIMKSFKYGKCYYRVYRDYKKKKCKVDPNWFGCGKMRKIFLDLILQLLLNVIKGRKNVTQDEKTGCWEGHSRVTIW